MREDFPRTLCTRQVSKHAIRIWELNFLYEIQTIFAFLDIVGEWGNRHISISSVFALSVASPHPTYSSFSLFSFIS